MSAGAIAADLVDFFHDWIDEGPGIPYVDQIGPISGGGTTDPQAGFRIKVVDGDDVQHFDVVVKETNGE